MIHKLKEKEMLPEAIATIVIVIALAFLFATVVIPNLAFKSVPVSWLTVAGGVAIFSYSIFVELNQEVGKDRFNTHVDFALPQNQPINYLVPHHARGASRIIEYQHQNFIVSTSSEKDAKNLIDFGRDLIILNILSYLGSEYKDWKTETVKSPTTTTFSWRAPEAAGRDRLVYECDLLNAACFEHISVKLPSESRREFSCSIFPPKTSIESSSHKVVVKNRYFEVMFEVYPLNHLFTQTVEGAGDFRISEYEIRSTYSLPKRYAGSRNRGEYRELCEELTRKLRHRLEVPAHEWPRSSGW